MDDRLNVKMELLLALQLQHLATRVRKDESSGDKTTRDSPVESAKIPSSISKNSMYPHTNPPYPSSNQGSAGFAPPGGHNPGGLPPSGFSPAPYPPASGVPSYPPTPNFPYSNTGPSPPYPGSNPSPYPPGTGPPLPYPGGSPSPGYPGSSPSPGYPVASPLPGYPGSSPAPGYPGNSPAPGYPGSIPPLPGGTYPSGQLGFGNSQVPLQSPYPGPPAAGLGQSPYPTQPSSGVYPSLGATGGSGSGFVQAQHVSHSYSSPNSSVPFSAAPSGYPHSPNSAYPAGQSPYPQQAQQAYPNLQASASPSQSVAKMQPYYETPTLRDGPFDPMADAAALRKAMKGFGTDEKAIITVLGHRTNNQRIQIANSFKASFGKDLISDLKSEVSGKFQDTLVAMLTPRYDYMAQRLHDAISGLGTKEMVLIDILCSASNQELRWITASYTRLYKNQLDKDIISDTSGCFRRLLVSLCVAQRSEDTRIDPGLVQQDAQALQAAGLKKWGTDESVFNMIMATRSYPHLREVFHAYEKVTGQDIERTINSEFSGDIKDAMNAIVKSCKNRAAYFAQRLRDSMKGMGTNDGQLIFLLVTRCEVDLENIKQEYQRMYNKALATDIKADTSGDYQKTLLALVG